MTAPATPRTKACEAKYRSLHPAVRIAELANLSESLETELAQVTAERDDCVKAFAEDSRRAVKAEAENAAQLAELTRIADALGTNEGHSSVVHIEALMAENAALLERCRPLISKAAANLYGSIARSLLAEIDAAIDAAIDNAKETK